MTAEQLLAEIHQLALSCKADLGIHSEAWDLADEIKTMIDKWRDGQVKAGYKVEKVS